MRQLDIFNDFKPKNIYPKSEMKMILKAVELKRAYHQQKVKYHENKAQTGRVLLTDTLSQHKDRLLKYDAILAAFSALDLIFSEVFDSEQLEQIGEAISFQTFELTPKKFKKGIVANQTEIHFEKILMKFNENELI